MKILWLLSLILLSACLQVKHQAVPSSHLTTSESHEGNDALAQLRNTFIVNCNSIEFLRNSYIEVENKLPMNIHRILTYLDSGKEYQNGNSPIAPNSTQKWIFIKKYLSTAGANGVIYFTNARHNVIVFFENPWSGMAGAGVALKPSFAGILYGAYLATGATISWHPEQTYNQMYNDWCDYKKTVTDKTKANSGWFRDAFYIETSKANFYSIGTTARITAPDNSFAIQLAFSYEGAKGINGFKDKCFNTKLSLKFVPT